MLQLAVSFGHVHEREFAGGIGSNAAGGWHKAIVAIVAKVNVAKSATSSPEKLVDDDDHCLICFSNFLLATSFVPGEAQPAPRFAPSEADHSSALAAFGVSESGRASFRSRAPPQA